MRPVGTLAASGVTKSHGAHVVLAGVDLVVPPHARIGLVGPNGAGKSTLLRLLAGEDVPDRGTVRRNPASLAVGHLPQERDPLDGETLLAYLARRTGVAAAAERMDGLAARLGDEPELAADYNDALDAFLARGGGDLDARAAAVLAELGLGVELDRAARRRSPAARRPALRSRRSCSAASTCCCSTSRRTTSTSPASRGSSRSSARSTARSSIVSHDRAFLDRTVTRVVELDEWTHGAREYAGGWSEYEAERARRRARHVRALGGLRRRARAHRGAGAAACSSGRSAATARAARRRSRRT